MISFSDILKRLFEDQEYDRKIRKEADDIAKELYEKFAYDFFHGENVLDANKIWKEYKKDQENRILRIAFDRNNVYRRLTKGPVVVTWDRYNEVQMITVDLHNIFDVVDEKFDSKLKLRMKPRSNSSDGGVFNHKGTYYTIDLFCLESGHEEIFETEYLDSVMDMFYKFRNTLVHEYVHLTDYIRFDDQLSYGVVRPEEDYEKYINSPVEFNARYQEYVNKIERTLRRGKDFGFYRAYLDDIDSKHFTFRGFYEHVLEYYFYDKFLNALNEKYQKKLRKRLYKFYKTIEDHPAFEADRQHFLKD